MPGRYTDGFRPSAEVPLRHPTRSSSRQVPVHLEARWLLWSLGLLWVTLVVSLGPRPAWLQRHIPVRPVVLRF